MTINFFLKEPTKTSESAVYIAVSVSGKRFKRSVGVKVKPSHWSGTKVKTLAANYESKNLKIDNAVNLLKDIEREYLLKNISLSKEILQREFDKRICPETAEVEKSFLDVFAEFIQVRKPLISANTIKTFTSCKNHLQKYAEEEGVELTFEDINLNFYDNLLSYFFQKQFLNSTIGKYIKLLKTFMEWAMERGLHSNIAFKKFLVFKEDSEKIKLSAEVVEKLRTTDFEDEFKNIVRDIFVISCYTGLRFIDIENLKPENIEDGYIRLHIQKTRENVEIPLLEVPKQIITDHFEKYGKLKVPTNQFCNREIKKLFKKIEFDTVIRFTKYSGSTRILVEKKAYDYMTMHYGRAFFVTNSLVNGMGEEFIRKITGHKDYKTFKKYVNLSKEMVADKLFEAWDR